MVEDTEYIKNKIQGLIINLVEEESKQAITYIVENKKTKAIGH